MTGQLQTSDSFFIIKEMKKIIEFKLNNPVKLIPLKGTTSVEVSTTGEVLIHDPAPSPDPRPRDIILTESIYGKLTSTPCGINHSVKITFPARLATRENFLLEVHALFDNLMLEQEFGI